MNRAELIESTLMILCIPVLWPVVRAFRSDVPLPENYEFVLGAAALVLAIITVRRIRRLRSAFRSTEKPPHFPF